MFTQLKNAFNKVSLSANQLILVVTFYFIALFNQPLLSLAFERIYALDTVDTIFAATLPIFFFAFHIIVFSLFSIKYVIKPVLVALTIISSLVYYGTTTYGVVFDYSMMVNVIETDNAEAFAYLNLNFVLFFLFSGIIPAVLIAMVNVRYNSIGKEVIARMLLVVCALATISSIAFLYYSDYASFFRNNRELRKYAIPLQYIDATRLVLNDRYFTEPREFETLDPAPVLTTKNDEHKNVVVLVLGETARAMNFSYNGYSKDTNEFTRKFSPTSFQKVTSCGTATAESVPCMFSKLDRKNFDKADATHQQNVLDIAQLSGVDVLWVNNNSGCKDVCNRVETINLSKDKSHPLCDGGYCFDEILLEPLEAKLNNLTEQTTLVVLHMIGSHGPTYYRRYPSEYRRFLPECPQSDIQNCSQESLINTYDNTLLYTDLVLSKVIEQLQGLPGNVNTSMLYVSDHGESLGESGAYLHGFPYAFAPKEQIEIPMIFWTSNNQQQIDKTCLADTANASVLSHDNLFSSLLGLLNVSSTTYEKHKDVFNCQ